jgi:hypothetical protein
LQISPCPAIFTPSPSLGPIYFTFGQYSQQQINPQPTSENCSTQGIATFGSLFSYEIFVTAGPNNGTCFGTYETYPSISPPAKGTVVVINNSNGVRIRKK